jgi:hypothetical protein
MSASRKRSQEWADSMARLRNAAGILRRNSTLQAAVAAAGLPADLVSISEAATLAAVSESTIRQRLKRWAVPVYGTHSMCRFSLAAVIPPVVRTPSPKVAAAGRINLQLARAANPNNQAAARRQLATTGIVGNGNCDRIPEGIIGQNWDC